MAKITRRLVSEQFQHFLEELKESFCGYLYAETRQAGKKFWEAQSARNRILASGKLLRSGGAGSCWPSDAVREKARWRGKACWRTCTGGVWRARTWPSL
jgi:hypothetical protein